MQFPDLSRYKDIYFDTETTGVDAKSRPFGCSVSVAPPNEAEQSWWFSWGAGDPKGLRGPADMNNCSLPDFVRWANVELMRSHQRKIGHYALFDMRQLAYVGLNLTNVECTQNLATLTNELRPSFSLDNLSRAHNLGSKADTGMHEWMVNHIPQLKNKKPTRKICIPYYWMVPCEIMREYAEFDPVLTGRYFRAAYPELKKQDVERVYRLECDLMPLLIKMHLCGVRVDRPRIEKIRGELGVRARQLTKQWLDLCHGEVVNYNSPDELRPWLDKWGVVYPLTPKTKKPSITKEWLEACDHPMGAMVRKMRQTAYYCGTSLESYILGNLEDDEDIIHGEFHPLRGDQYGTITGRFSSGGGLNLQNIPARDKEWAPLLRSVFRPMRDDQQWLKVDYSQIEYRLFAHYAGLMAKHRGGTSAMEMAYVNDPHVDFHQWVAETAHIERKRAKNVNFCRLYGGGIAKIAITAACSIEEATIFVNAYDQAIPEASALMKDITSASARRGYVTTWYGRKCRFRTEGEMASKYGTQPRGNPNKYGKTYTGLNKVLQGSAADIIKVAMVELDRSGVVDFDNTQLHLQVHDELDFSIPRGEEGVRIKNQIVDIMQEAGKTPMWSGDIMQVPVIAEADLGPNWGMLE